jgi:hypothetical protein
MASTSPQLNGLEELIQNIQFEPDTGSGSGSLPSADYATNSKLELVRILVSTISDTLKGSITVAGELTLDDSTPLSIDKVGLATDAKSELIRLLLVAVDSKLGSTLNIDKSSLSTSALQSAGNTAIAAINTTLGSQSTAAAQEAQRLLLLNLATESKLEAVRALIAGTLTVQQVSTDILRLRALTPRKPAAVTLTTTTAVDLIPVPANPAHRHVICWLCGQNATDAATVAEFTGGVVPIKVVAPVKGSGIDRAADPQVMTLNAGAAFRVGQSVATTFEASCGYYTIDATGAPV